MHSRQIRYHDALSYQARYDVIPYDIAKPLAAALFGFGQVLVLTSTYALGITGALTSPSTYGSRTGSGLTETETEWQERTWATTSGSSWTTASRVFHSTSCAIRCTMARRCVSSEPLSGVSLLPRKTAVTKADLGELRMPRSRSPAGLVLSVLVYIVYTVALTYEGCVSVFISSHLPFLIVMGHPWQPFHRHDLLQPRRQVPVKDSTNDYLMTSC